MATYSKGEVILVLFPYTSGAVGKVRPALVLADSGDQDVLVARLTSKAFATSYDLPVVDWQGAGLFGPTTVRLHKISTVDKNNVRKKIGVLSPTDHQQVSDLLRQIFGSW